MRRSARPAQWQAGGADRGRHRLGRPPPDPRRRDGRLRESLGLEGLLGQAQGTEPQGVELVVSDDHAGLVAAIGEVIPEVAWQRCYVHFLRNAFDHLPRKHGDDCLPELRWLMQQAALLLQLCAGRREGRVHDGKVMVVRSNLRWCSDGLEFACWNGEIIRMAFIIDASTGRSSPGPR